MNFQDTEGWKVANPQDSMLRGKWWQIFNDPELNALEEQVNVNNQNIKQYFENLMEARAIIREPHAQYWPTVTANPSWARQRSSTNLTNSTQANTGRTSTLISFPVDVAWVPDFWGKIRNQVREAQYAAQVSAADLANEQLIEQASLAAYYFEILGQDALAKILDQTVQADRKALDVTIAAYQTGVGDYISVTEVRGTLEAVQTADINVKIARAVRACDCRIGRQSCNRFFDPGSSSTWRTTSDSRRGAVPIIGTPSRCCCDRANPGRSQCDYRHRLWGIFPQVTLSVVGGFNSSTFQKWFTWPRRFWSIGPSVSQTVFNGGLYRAQLNQYTATYNADLALYRQTVLTAFQQVEDYLAAVRLYSQQIKHQQAVVDNATETLKLAMSRYETGIDPYLNVTAAQATLLSDQQTLATIQVEEMTSAVFLIEALGGGWDRSQLPTPSDLGSKPPNSETILEQ